MFLGLRTIIYPAPDLDAAKAWWTQVLGIEPYFDEPFYVGYEVGGYELGLDPDPAEGDGPVTYWGVEDCASAIESLIATGAKERGAPQDVGGGVIVASVIAPDGQIVGVIENPHFKLPDGAG